MVEVLVVTLHTKPGFVHAMRFLDDGRTLGTVMRHPRSDSLSLHIWSTHQNQARPYVGGAPEYRIENGNVKR